MAALGSERTLGAVPVNIRYSDKAAVRPGRCFGEQHCYVAVQVNIVASSGIVMSDGPNVS